MSETTTNAFRNLWDLGYRRLVPIVPPGSPVSERSSLFKRIQAGKDDRGKSPGIRGGDGDWRGFDWLKHEADEPDLTRWHSMGAGVGIKTGDLGDGTSLVLIDADTLDMDFAATIKTCVEDMLGVLPVRIGKYPKAGYLARVKGTLRYSRVEFGSRANDRGQLLDRVEVLSDGRQFVAEGTHPGTMQPYRWPKDLPALSELPILPEGAIQALLGRLADTLPKASEVKTEGASAEHVDQQALRGDPDMIRRAVEATPNTSDLFPTREAWRDFGYAIKAAMGPENEQDALQLFTDWSMRWDDDPKGEGNDPGHVEAEWRRFKPPFKRGAGWLFEQAEEASAGSFSRAHLWFEPPQEPLFPEEERPKKGDLYPLLRVGDIINRPPQKWYIQRHIPEQSVGFLYSEPGIGKSFLMLDIALHIAAGMPDWHGDPITVPNDAAVLYIAAEGSYGFRNRIKAWAKRKKLDPNCIERFFMIEHTINFMSIDDVAKLNRTVSAASAQFGVRFCLVVVDTVSRAIPGADENLQAPMTLFVEACGSVRQAFGCAVVGVHHAGKNGDLRGSTVLRGAGDFVFRLSRKKGASVGDLYCEKQKDAPDQWGEPYHFEAVGLDGGDTSLVVSRADLTVGPTVELTPDIAEQVLSDMRAAWEAKEPWSKAPQAGDRKAVKRMVLDHGFDAARAAELITVWESTGMIRMEIVDSVSKRRGFKVVSGPRQVVPDHGVFG